MKNYKEIENGFLLFLGIGIFFLILEVANLSNIYWLRALNFPIVVYFLNRQIKHNLSAGKLGFYQNMFSCFLAGFIGIFLGILGLILYLNFKGGEDYVKNLSKSFLLGGNLSIIQYSFALFMEGIASILIVSYMNVQYWRLKKVFKEDFIQN